MEFEVKNDIFYALVVGNVKKIFETENEAILSLKLLAQKPDIDPEKLELLELKIGEKWEIKAIPWSRIAIGLIRGEK